MSAHFNHFTLADRIVIESGLHNNVSFKKLASELGCHPSSVSQEVRKHLFKKKSGGLGRAFNDCSLRFSCKHADLCGVNFACSKKYCRFCVRCMSVCREYSRDVCPRLLKAPYVCNGCNDLRRCSLEKSLYSADAAQAEYAAALHEAHSGVSAGEDDILRIDAIVSPLVRRGQSIYHICANNRDALMCSERTVYNYLDCGLLNAANLDLPRKVRFRARRCREHFKVDRSCRLGRTYEDFLAFMHDDPDSLVTEIDSVEGRVGGKVLLTIHFTDSSFMLAFLRDANTSQSVIDVFDYLYELLGQEAFKSLFNIVLGDNGSEFSNPKALEFDHDGNRRAHVFYCDPSSPYQKGGIENNHEFPRRILPKGSSFDDLCQDDVSVMMDNVNSYKRRKLGNRSPYEVFSFLHGPELLENLGTRAIPPDEIVLKPWLLKKSR